MASHYLKKLNITAITYQERRSRGIRNIGSRTIVCSVHIKMSKTVVNDADSSPTSSVSGSAVETFTIETIAVSFAANEKKSLKELLAVLGEVILRVTQLIDTLLAD